MLHLNPVILAKKKSQATATGEKNKGGVLPASTDYVLPSKFIQVPEVLYTLFYYPLLFSLFSQQLGHAAQTAH